MASITVYMADDKEATVHDSEITYDADWVVLTVDSKPVLWVPTGQVNYVTRN